MTKKQEMPWWLELLALGFVFSYLLCCAVAPVVLILGWWWDLPTIMPMLYMGGYIAFGIWVTSTLENYYG